MGLSFTACDHADWAAYNLADYEHFSEMTTDRNVDHDGFEITKGEWFYVADEPVTVPEQGTFRVIYHGTWGNDNAPGASHYTYAELFDTSDADDMREFEERVKDWESQPEDIRTYDDEAE